MTCVTKEYKIKTKMEQEWLQLKMTFLLGYNLKISIEWGGETDFWWGEDKNLVGEGDFSR